jgi:uncharacterized protein with PQ loop repeat
MWDPALQTDCSKTSAKPTWKSIASTSIFAIIVAFLLKYISSSPTTLLVAPVASPFARPLSTAVHAQTGFPHPYLSQKSTKTSLPVSHDRASSSTAIYTTPHGDGGDLKDISGEEDPYQQKVSVKSRIFAAAYTFLFAGGVTFLRELALQGSLSKALGFLSLGIFVISQVPQIVKSQRTKKADDLSIDFLCLWLVGDMCGLIGTYLIGATPTQIISAWYFLLSCIVLVAQWWAFSRNSRSGAGMSKASKGFWLSSGIMTVVGFVACILQGMSQVMIGTYLGWVSGAVYLISRIPQIWQNFQTREVEDLSIYLFLLAMLGNILYGASVLAYSTEAAWIWKQIPFLLGSMGTVVFDLILVFQIILFRKPKNEPLLANA